MTKQWRIILSVLGVLILLYVINNFTQQKLSSSAVTIFLVDKGDVHSFRISKGINSIELTKKDTVWAITGHDTLTVKSAVLNIFFDTSLKVKRELLVSKTPDNWGMYSLDDSTGTFLMLFDINGIEIGQAVFGRSKSEWSKNFVRIGSEEEVFQTDNSIVHNLQTNPEYWGEKSKPLDKELIEPIDIN